MYAQAQQICDKTFDTATKWQFPFCRKLACANPTVKCRQLGIRVIASTKKSSWPGRAARIPSKRANHSHRLHMCDLQHTWFLSRSLRWALQVPLHGQEYLNPSKQYSQQHPMRMNDSLQHKPAKIGPVFLVETRCAQIYQRSSVKGQVKALKREKWGKSWVCL